MYPSFFARLVILAQIKEARIFSAYLPNFFRKRSCHNTSQTCLTWVFLRNSSAVYFSYVERNGENFKNANTIPALIFSGKERRGKRSKSCGESKGIVR